MANTPWPDRLEWKPNRIRGYHLAHLTRARRVAVSILDRDPARARQARVAAPGEDPRPRRVRRRTGTGRPEYNSVRLPAAIGYVTPNDEHEGRGDAIRQARRDGLPAARIAARRIEETP